MSPDAPGSTPGFPEGSFQLKNSHVGEIQKLEKFSIRAVSWHLRDFQKPTGPPLSGRLGLSRYLRELSYVVRSTLPPLRLSGGPQVDRTQPVTMRRQTLKNRHILLTPIESGSLGAPVKQVEIQLRFPPASHVRVVSAIANLTPEQNSRRSKMMEHRSCPK